MPGQHRAIRSPARTSARPAPAAGWRSSPPVPWGTMDRQRPPIVADERTQLVGWFNVLFLGEPATGPMFDGGDEDADMMVSSVHLDAIRELLDGTKGYY